MKKLLIMAAVVASAIVANAATFKWTGANVYGPDGKKIESGTASLYCDALSASSLTTTSISSGTFTAKTFDVTAKAGDEYSFYYVINVTSSGKDYTFKSGIAKATASETGTANIPFGNQANATQAAGAWVAVPEPTSGLLMLLGLAGLALKRKRA